MDARQIDKDGEWVVNRSQYRIAHGTRAGVTFDPARPVQIKVDPWIERQKDILVKVADPFGNKPEEIKGATPLRDGNKDSKK